MDESANQKPNRKPAPKSGNREISNANLFADDIIFSDTEKILFEEDLNETATRRDGLMDGNPADRYTPHQKLNEGGMKAIWEVDDHRTARKVAMALIQDSKIASEADIDSFLYEARLTANLQHPNIIPIYDIAVDENGNPYFTMKALKGETLGDIIKKLRQGSPEYSKRYTRTRLLGIFLKVCNAIDYAHTKGVIHLDLKPSNVIVGDFGDVHVLDWGLSTLITHLDEYDGAPVSWQSLDDVALENGQTLTRYLESSAKRRHVVGGTPGYMSPEQAQGSPADIDFQTDIYMLGAMLYELLTFECPITGDTVREVLQKTVRGDFPEPAKRAPKQKIPPALAAIVMKSMKTDPSERYPNVSGLIRDIHQYQDGFATLAENPTFITHFALLVRRHKLAVSLIGISSIIIGVILTNSFISVTNSEKVARDALASLKEKNDFIAQTAKQVAPDYLDLAQREERSYAFEAAEQDLDRSLAFDPSNPEAWNMKLRMLLAQQRFAEAREILAGETGPNDDEALRKLANSGRYVNPVTDSDLPRLATDFRANGLGAGIPRLFYEANRAPFNPSTRFQAIAEALRQLNPTVQNLNFSWKPVEAGGWHIDISNNPGLDDITPLCGLRIVSLNAEKIGAPDLALLPEKGLKSLDLSDVRLNHLPAQEKWTELETLDISGTRIRNLAGLVEFPRLATLDISRIDGLSISPQLIWCRNLKMLTVAETFRNDPTVQSLARRGVIIIYTRN
ncbi:MAG: protein kinase [Pontiellaceae bacterium]|nr:protein kinase [Pontiellaceae bacterium]MBN2785248.1 protein kinase [Pontiellaceae bacterium]